MKTTFFRLILLCTCTALIAVACTNDVVQPGKEKEQVSVLISADAGALQKPLSGVVQGNTRVANNVWNEDDAIGVIMIEPTEMKVFGTFKNNCYKTKGDGKFTPIDGAHAIFFPSNDAEVTFKSYYPYKEDLPSTMVIPVSTKNQDRLSEIDLMTAEHLSGTSTKDPNVKLHFHHRLAKVVVKLTADNDASTTLAGAKVVMKGLRTEASYNLMDEKMTVDNTLPLADVEIPVANTQGNAILLPRAAGEGVVFEITTPDGGKYTAAMSSSLELKQEYVHTFNIRLKSSTEVSATVEPWLEGPEQRYELIRVVTGLGKTEGFAKGHVLDLFMKESAGADFARLNSFTYDGEANWTPQTPLYWESIAGNPVQFRGTVIFDKALNNTQMDDILVSEDVEVAPFTGINLALAHAGVKVTTVLSSSDGTYTEEALKNASIIFPGYLNSGSCNDKGEFIIATSRGNILPVNNVAIFPPQEIPTTNTLIQVSIAGHTYEVKEAFSFKAGMHHILSLNIGKSGVAMTARLLDWVDGENYEKEVRIGTAEMGENENIPDGSQLHLFTEELQGGARADVPGYFTYNKSGNTWSYSNPSNPLFWEMMPNEGRIFASMVHEAVNGTKGYNQSKDYIVATPIENNGGTSNTALHFDMRHAVSQVRVVLRPSDIYTQEQLKNAVVTLPGYTTGGTLDKGVYVPGTGSGDIRLDLPDNADISSRTYLQAQVVPTGQTVVRVVVDPDGTGSLLPRTYDVTYNHDVIYNAGEITHLYITIHGSELQMSVKVTGWANQTPVELQYAFDQDDTSVSGFETGDVIRFYSLGNGTTVNDSKNYVVGMDGVKHILYPQGTPWFRDDFNNGERIVAVFPAPDVVPGVANSENTFDWDMAGKSDPTNRINDILVATNGVIKDKSVNVDLSFKHVLSKVTVNIIKGDGFEDGEIENGNPSVQLVEFMQQGKVNISDGTIADLKQPGSFKPVAITPQKDAVLSYQALLLPQVKESNPLLVKVTLNGILYDANWTGTFNFEAGKHHVLNITLAKTGLKLSASVAEWEQGSSGSIIIK